jgi:hypothetical protein
MRANREDYLEHREQQELEAARKANDSRARQAHQELAARYAWQRELKARISEEVG